MAMLHFRYARALTALKEDVQAKKHKELAQAIQSSFLKLYPRYLSSDLTEEEIFNQMIPIWAGRFTGGLVQQR